MKFSEFDTHLRAEHLPHSVTVTIERFEKITVHPRPGKSEQALSVRFVGKRLPLILSNWNRHALRSLFSDDCDTAIGQRVTLAVEPVTVAGSVKQVIRIRAAQPEVKLAENKPLANTTAVPDTDSSTRLSDVVVVAPSEYTRARSIN